MFLFFLLGDDNGDVDIVEAVDGDSIIFTLCWPSRAASGMSSIESSS